MVKVYEYLGKNNVVTNFFLKNKKLRITFEGGYIFDKKNATFTTNNFEEQFAIENDPRFGVEIMIKATYPEECDKIVSEIKRANQTATKKDGAKK